MRASVAIRAVVAKILDFNQPWLKVGRGANRALDAAFGSRTALGTSRIACRPSGVVARANRKCRLKPLMARLASGKETLPFRLTPMGAANKQPTAAWGLGLLVASDRPAIDNAAGAFRKHFSGPTMLCAIKAPFVALVAWLTIGMVYAIGAGTAETLQIEVRETAGIRRFGYPVAVKLPELSMVGAKARFRLREGAKSVPAQFRHESTDGGIAAWWLDFNLSMMPNEVRNLTLEYGPDVAADAEPRGLELKQTSDGFEIHNAPHLTWTAGQGLLSLVTSVDAGDLQYLRSEGVRLTIEGPNGTLHARDVETAAPRVIRSGPLAVAIRYESAPTTGPLAEIKSTVDLTFPVSKSWVQVDWKIDDLRQTVRSVRAEIAQQLAAATDDEPTLVDFGASSLVYMSLGPEARGKLQGSRAAAQPNGPLRQSWEVLRGDKNRLEPFVVQAAGHDRAEAEGWAHIMDRSRCLALAVDEFGDVGEDSIELTAKGDITLARNFSTAGPDRPITKSFRFWLHFVGFPPHVTAATSPQSMLSPLTVRISKP